MEPITRELTKQEMMMAGKLAGELARQDILSICENSGLTPQTVIRKILDAMDACSTKQQWREPQYITIKNANGESERVCVNEGGWIEAPPLIDHQSRLAAVKLGKEILGLDAPKRLDSTVHHDFISPETAELVTRITSRASVCITEGAQVTITHARRITASFKDFSNDEADVPIEIGEAAE